MRTKGVSPRWRTAALVAIGVAIGSTITAAPVSSHVGGTVAHLWTHLRPKADARYFTKAQANARFLGKAGKAADADMLDGQDSTAFLGAGAQATDSDRLDGLHSSAFLGAGAQATDSDRLDGLHSSAFLGVNAKAADADLLDGVDSSAFQRACRSGTLHAFGLVRGASGFSSTFVEVPESFTCWRGTGRVAARRVSTGRYEVILSGSPFNTFCLTAPLVVGSISGDSNNFFSYEPVPCAALLETRITVWNTSSGGTLQDGFFTFAWLRVLG